MPRPTDSYLAKPATIYKPKTGVGCGGVHSKVPLDLARERIKEVVEFLEKVETVREMAATSLDNDALLNSEECHEQADHCANAYDDSLMGSL